MDSMRRQRLAGLLNTTGQVARQAWLASLALLRMARMALRSVLDALGPWVRVAAAHLRSILLWMLRNARRGIAELRGSVLPRAGAMLAAMLAVTAHQTSARAAAARERVQAWQRQRQRQIAERQESPSGEATQAPLARLFSAERWRGSLPALSPRWTGGSSTGSNGSAKPQNAWMAAWRRYRTPALITLTVVSVLVASLLPPLISLQTAFADYQQLRDLGNAGFQHLLAAKDDLSGLAKLSDLQQLIPPATTPPAAPAAYTDLLQHQGGTADGITVSVHPSSQLAQAGLKDQDFDVTLTANTAVQYGVAPTPTPSPPAATPSPTPSPTPPSGASGSQPQGGSGLLPDPAEIDHALASAAKELHAAQQDFTTLRARLSDPDWVLSLAGSVTKAKNELASVQQLAAIGAEVATLGLEALGTLTPLFERLKSGVFASADSPLLTTADITALHQMVQDADTVLGDVTARVAHVDLSQLPVSASQRVSFTSLIGQLPGLREKVQQVGPWLDVAAWVLGVGQPRNFLVQTLDRTELRATGGFTGDYGVLTFTNGRLAPFTLYNINDIEYGYKSNGWIYGKRPPDAYSWWPFANWGLRDSNLSADFPTTAQMNIQLFHNEGAGDVDGVIQFTVTLIAHMLRVTGPIFVPGYNETVTADNLEQRIEFYQQDPAGIAIEQKLNPNDHTHSLRKRFTQLVTQLLQDKVKHLTGTQLVSLAHQVLDDLKSKDLQIYVSNPQLEQTLKTMGIAGTVTAPANQDTYMFVQSNVSIAKSTPYVQVSQYDDVTLDNQGGATHRLTLTLYNNPTGPIYGYPTYRDYLRIYVPASARFTSGWGFDQMTPMCYTPPPAAPGAPPAPPPPQYAGLPTCPTYPYSSAERRCPDSSYYAYNGEATKVLGWSDTPVPALDSIGGPTNTTSDLPGFAMRAGYVMIPQKCTARVTLRWYVPNVVHPPAK